MKNYALIGVLLLCWAGGLQAQSGGAMQFRDGVHYFSLNMAEPARKSDVITVTELFSYGCHACNDFEPHVQSWKKKQAEDVRLNRIPVGFGRRAWELLAKGYMIAEIMGVEDEAHVPLMNAIWRDGKQLRSLEDMADFYAQHGADKAKFLALDGSFMLNMRMKQNTDKLRLYALKGTPTMIVNGRYKIQTSQAVPNYQAMLTVVDFLVEQERAAMAPAVAESEEDTGAEAESAAN